VNGVRIINVYVPNGQSLESDKYQYKLRWLNALIDYVRSELASHDKLVLLGDFNIAPEDRDVHDPKAWQGSVLVSEAERNALRTLMSLGLFDVFRQFEQAEKSFSWWTIALPVFVATPACASTLFCAARECLRHASGA
jgi:exodeoxyribonuclease-3